MLVAFIVITKCDVVSNRLLVSPEVKSTHQMRLEFLRNEQTNRHRTYSNSNCKTILLSEERNTSEVLHDASNGYIKNSLSGVHHENSTYL